MAHEVRRHPVRGFGSSPRVLPQALKDSVQKVLQIGKSAEGSHDVKNLFIVDGSIFVTSAGVNPTRTIQALALYIADSIKQRLATLFD